MAISRHQKKGTIIFVIIVSAVVLLAIVFSQRNSPDDFIFQQKSRVLSIASTDKPLTSEAREAIFQYIGGSKVEQYNFTSEEKFRLINVINRK